MNLRFSHLLQVSGILLLLLCAGCGNPLDPIVEAVRLLDDTATRVLDESNAWRGELDRALDLAEDLPDEVKSIVRNELSNTLNRAIATTSGELRCTIKFVRDLIHGDIQRIIARLRNQPVEPPDPTICTVSPEQVDMGLEANERASLVYFGYNMPLDPQDGVVQVELVRGDQTSDISRHLTVTTEFQMVLNLGANGVRLTSDSDTIRLLWNGRRLSSVPVIQATCQTKEAFFELDNHTFTPPRTAGDRDFDGNGPNVEVVLQLIARPRRVNAILFMIAEEEHADGRNAGDGTAVRGFDESLVDLYNPETGWEIVRIIGSNEAVFKYRDTDHAEDVKTFASGPVREFRVTGDTSGNEAGTETGVEIEFHEIRVLVRQTANCVP